MSENISNLIDAIVDDNAVDAEKTFNSIMADKIADRLQSYRQEVSNKFFNPEANSETEFEVEEDETHASE